MKSLLVWSGGLDSTKILLDLIDRKESFDTIYFNLENNEIKTKAELRARNLIKNFFKEKNIKWRDYTNTVKFTINPSALNCYFPTYQPLVWIMSIIFFLGIHKEYSKIYMGYIKEDDFWHYKSDFLNIFDSMWNITFSNTESYKLKPQFLFPLEWDLKQQIYNSYTDEYKKEIRPLIWTCENPHIINPRQLFFNFYNSIAIDIITDPNDPSNITKEEQKIYMPCGQCDPCKKFSKLKDEITSGIVCKENYNNEDDPVQEKEIKKEEVSL